MAFADLYRRQVGLIVRALPHVAAEPCFALKGGTAINLFVRDLPRLSVDIDLTYLPIEPREQSLAAIDEKQLIRLIAAKASESRDNEYKRDTYGDADADRAEWLADVSSFANTAGGDLIIGMEAAKGVPTRIAPLTMDIDQEIRWPQGHKAVRVRVPPSLPSSFAAPGSGDGAGGSRPNRGPSKPWRESAAFRARSHGSSPPVRPGSTHPVDLGLTVTGESLKNGERRNVELAMVARLPAGASRNWSA